MLATSTLNAIRRDRVGSRYSRRVREQGLLPAVVYGHKQDPVAISVDAKDTIRRVMGGEKVFELMIDGRKETVLLKELQYGYLGNNLVHLDFERVDLDEKIETNVVVRLLGEAVGLKTAGAILVHPVTSIEVRCTVRTLPSHLEADISHLEVGKALHAGDVPLPPGVELVSDAKTIIAAVELTKEEVAPVAEAAAVEGEAAQPEVITAKKKEGEEGEAAAAAPAAKEKKKE